MWSPRWQMGWWAISRRGLHRQVRAALMTFGRRDVAYTLVASALVEVALKYPFVELGSMAEVEAEETDVLLKVQR
jgi:hypothetical protein